MRLKITRKNLPLLATFALFLLIYGAGAIAYSGFLSPRVFVNLLYDNAFLGIIAVGMTFVILSGGIDLSVGSLLGFAGALCANLLSSYGVHPVVLLLGAYMLHVTKFGRNAYAIGGNEKSAVLMGLPVKRTKILISTFNSTMCAVGGLVYSLCTLSGYPRAGQTLELDVIASVVIGGTLLSGGVGFVEGTLVGVLILGLIQTIITIQGTLSTWRTKIFIGILMSMFILLQTYMSGSSFDRRFRRAAEGAAGNVA